jgi:hypothetical protein
MIRALSKSRRKVSIPPPPVVARCTTQQALTHRRNRFPLQLSVDQMCTLDTSCRLAFSSLAAKWSASRSLTNPSDASSRVQRFSDRWNPSLSRLFDRAPKGVIRADQLIPERLAFKARTVWHTASAVLCNAWLTHQRRQVDVFRQGQDEQPTVIIGDVDQASCYSHTLGVIGCVVENDLVWRTWF